MTYAARAREQAVRADKAEARAREQAVRADKAEARVAELECERDDWRAVTEFNGARLSELFEAGERVAVLQPASYAKNRDEADRWAEFYRSLKRPSLSVSEARLP